jgi:hypothetical protein
MIVPMATPVAAASPKVVGYVTGSCQGGLGVQPDASFEGTVKLLSDGTIVGSWHLHFFKSFGEDILTNTEWKCDEFDGLIFPDANTAVFWGTFTLVNNNHQGKGVTFTGGFQIMDNSEPGIGQDTWLMLGMPAPIPVEHGNFQVYYAGNP